MLRNECLFGVVRTVCRHNAYHTAVLPEGGRALINGTWTHAESNATFEVRNPFSGDVLYEASNCDAVDANKSVNAAKAASEQWALEMTGKQRGAVLSKWYQLMNQYEAQLAELLTLEQGKPLAEARGEIQYSASFLDWYAGEARRIYGQVVPACVPHRMHVHTREPIGVVALITPWNFPTAMLARKAAAALSVGCTVVAKPAEDTPLSALAFAQLGVQAGLPHGVFNVLPADRVKTAHISKYLCSSADVDAISFTGSTTVGKLLLTQSADTVKRVCLELGGNAPLLVFPSADLDQAVQGTMASKFRGSGQTCISANRVLVDASVHDAFVAKLKVAMHSLVLGDGMQKGVTLGPLINERAVQKIEQLVVDAVNKGAQVVCGGKRGHHATLYQPTLLIDVKPNMLIANQEIFGPVAAVVKFQNEQQALEMANASRSGLAGYLYSRDVAQMARVSRRMQVGMVGVNETMISCAEAAFGGVKESGLGREGGSQGIDEFSQWKYICTGY